MPLCVAQIFVAKQRCAAQRRACKRSTEYRCKTYTDTDKTFPMYVFNSKTRRILNAHCLEHRETMNAQKQSGASVSSGSKQLLRQRGFLAILLALFFCAVAVSQATTTLSFEDLPGPWTAGAPPLPSNYAGLTWTNWVHYGRPSPPYDPGTGQVRLFPQGNTATVQFGQDVTFVGAYLAGKVSNQYFEGYKNGVKIFTSSPITGVPFSAFGQFVTLNWAGVDEIRLQTPSTDQTALDDFQYEINALPADVTPPTFGDCPVGGPFLVNSGLQVVGPITAQDAESGIDAVASTLSGSIDTSLVGPRLVSFTAVNTAGLRSMKDCEYKVQYDFSGFSQPVDNGITNLAKAGQAIPIKWRLTDGNGVPISDPNSFISVSSSATLGGCGGSADAIETYAGAAVSGLQYLGNGYWQFNWKTPKSYAGQCRTMTLNLNDGAPGRTADFQFK